MGLLSYNSDITEYVVNKKIAIKYGDSSVYTLPNIDENISNQYTFRAFVVESSNFLGTNTTKLKYKLIDKNIKIGLIDKNI